MFDLRHYICISSSDQFYGSFLSGRVLVYLDEATYGGDKRDMGTLKDRVTGDYLVVNRKHISQVQEPSMLHLIVASNEDWPIGIDGDDRRITVFRVANDHANDPSYFRPLSAELENSGRAAFLHTLMQMNINDDMLRRPHDTAARNDLKERSMPPLAKWWLDKLMQGVVLVTDKTWPKEIGRVPTHNDYLSQLQNMGVVKRLGPRDFWAAFTKLCPSSVRVRPHGQSPRQALPPIDIARAEFEKAVGVTFDWPTR